MDTNNKNNNMNMTGNGGSDVKELSEIKEMWQSINSRLDSLENNLVDYSRQAMDGNLKSVRDRLAAKYKRISIFSFLFCFLIPASFWTNNMYSDAGHEYTVALCIIFFIFFLTGGLMDMWLYNEVMNLDPGIITVSDMAKRSVELRHRHHIFQFILIPFAIFVLGFMAYGVADDTNVIIGMCVGGVLGLLIGIRCYLKMMEDYRSLIRSANSWCSEE